MRPQNSSGRRSSLLIQNSKLQGVQLFEPRWIMIFWFCPYSWSWLQKMCRIEILKFIWEEIQPSNPKLKTTGCPIIWATVNHDFLILSIFMNLNAKSVSTFEFIWEEIQPSNPKLKTTGCPIIWATVNHDILILSKLEQRCSNWMKWIKLVQKWIKLVMT